MMCSGLTHYKLPAYAPPCSVPPLLADCQHQGQTWMLFRDDGRVSINWVSINLSDNMEQRSPIPSQPGTPDLNGQRYRNKRLLC